MLGTYKNIMDKLKGVNLALAVVGATDVFR